MNTVKKTLLVALLSTYILATIGHLFYLFVDVEEEKGKLERYIRQGR